MQNEVTEGKCFLWLACFTISLAVVDDRKLRKPNPCSLQAASGALWVEYSSIWHPSKLLRDNHVLFLAEELLTGSGSVVVVVVVTGQGCGVVEGWGCQ